MIDTVDLVLASKSARRSEILRLTGLPFRIVTLDVDESIDNEIPPDRIVEELSMRKAGAVKMPDSVVIGADTIVYCDGKVLGKPKDTSDAYEMLMFLSGKRHQVYTGVTVIGSGKTVMFSECTDVKFRELYSSEVQRYINCEPPLDKAGAYGIQDSSGMFVERIEGDYYNVVGLPLCRLVTVLRGVMGTQFF